MDFDSVVTAWDKAPVTAIHPLRNVSDTAYWDSGRAQAVDAARHIPEGGSVVDFGCGDGRIAIPLARMGFHVYAVDASAAMLKRVKTHATRENVPLVTVKSDGLNLATKFLVPVDAVVCRAVLIHHIHEDVVRLVHNLTSVLKPGGFLVADWPVGRHHERRDWIDVTTWEPKHRSRVAHAAGLELVEDDTPTVWRKH